MDDVPIDIGMAADALTALGALVGVVGVSIAIWLQMIAPRKVPGRYVLGFYAFGALFLLLNAGAFGVGKPAAWTIAVLALLFTLGVEVYAAVYVYRRFSEPCDEISAEELLENLPPSSE